MVTPIFIAGMRGTGKSTAADWLSETAEVIDAEYLQYKAAGVIEPNSSNEQRYAWTFWTGERLRQLPKALSEVFLARHGANGSGASVIAVSASILVKDWYFGPLAAVLSVHRPTIDWRSAKYLVLDYAPEEILARIRCRDRTTERGLTLASVHDTAQRYREMHALQSFVPWKLVQEPQSMHDILLEVKGGGRHPAPGGKDLRSAAYDLG